MSRIWSCRDGRGESNGSRKGEVAEIYRHVKTHLPSRYMTSKASGSDEILAELFQIVKDDAIKVLHSMY